MKKYVNGEYIEMTAEEIAAMAAEAAERTRPLTTEEVTALLIKQQINTLEVDDNTALRMVEFYPEWAAGVDYSTGYKAQHGGKLWRCLQAHTSQSGWEPEMPRRCGRKSARHTTERSTIQSRTAEIWRWRVASIIYRTM